MEHQVCQSAPIPAPTIAVAATKPTPSTTATTATTATVPTPPNTKNKNLQCFHTFYERSTTADTLIMYSIRLCECGSTTASTQMRGLTCVVSRYVMRSNSPSGGMKEIVRSFSKRASLTHLWNSDAKTKTQGSHLQVRTRHNGICLGRLLLYTWWDTTTSGNTSSGSSCCC